jgi:hypothetical protein
MIFLIYLLSCFIQNFVEKTINFLKAMPAMLIESYFISNTFCCRLQDFVLCTYSVVHSIFHALNDLICQVSQLIENAQAPPCFIHFYIHYLYKIIVAITKSRARSSLLSIFSLSLLIIWLWWYYKFRRDGTLSPNSNAQ